MEQKKLINIILLGSLIIALGSTLVSTFVTYLGRVFALFEPTTTAVVTAQTQLYFVWVAAVYILVLLAYIAAIVFTIKLAVMKDKTGKKATACAWTTFGLYAGMLVLTFIFFWTVPNVVSLLKPNPWDSDWYSYYTNLRSSVTSIVVYTGIASMIAGWQTWTPICGKICGKFSKKDKTEKEPKAKKDKNA